MPETTRRGRLVTYLLLPAIVAAVVVLGAIVFRASFKVEQLRQQSVVEATLSLANEKVDRLDHLIIDEDNVLATEVDVADPSRLGRRWLPTAARETPTIRAVLVIDLEHDEHDVVAFASRAPGPEDETLRRLALRRVLPDLEIDRAPGEELRHLHKAYGGQSYLVSYWQRTAGASRFLVLAWHDVPRLVHEVFPKIYGDASGKARLSVVDEDGRPVFGAKLAAGEFTVGRPFPTTLYQWRVQVALTAADDLGARVERRRLLETTLITTACFIIVVGVALVLVAVERERRLSQQKSEFVANVSHELKTPLAVVRMFAEMLSSDRVPAEEKRKQYLGIIQQETERLTALVDNVLDFSRVERGKAAFDFAMADVAAVVARAVDVVRLRAERDGMTISFAAPEHLPEVRVDARSLELAVINLLDNAHKYAAAGGQVDVAIVRKLGFVEIAVKDDGPGIPPDEKKRIFDRFTRGKAARDAQIRGTGIGLSLVKHIAESHRGYVRVESTQGAGATFVIGLPLEHKKTD